jgi:integrase
LEIYGTTTSTIVSPQRAIDKTLDKFKSKGLDLAAEFLSNIRLGGDSTARTYSFPLGYFNDYLESRNYNLQTVIDILVQKKLDVYKLLSGYVWYLKEQTKNGRDMSGKSIKLYLSAVKSYLQYNDIDISQVKFKHQVKMPIIYTEGEEPINANDIREMLNHCTNRRLKAYMLVLASGGMRALEALAIRLKDINFDGSPTEIRIRKEYTKTRTERTTFISDEATEYLKQWIAWKYTVRPKSIAKPKKDTDLVFAKSLNVGDDPHAFYVKILIEFQKLLELCNGLSTRKEDGVLKRRKITFHSFRRFAKTAISNQLSADYSEWFLGHRGSSYWRVKQEEKRKMYKDNCMKYLTFLSYPTVEATGTSYEAKLQEKDRAINQLQKDVAELMELKKLLLEKMIKSGQQEDPSLYH